MDLKLRDEYKARVFGLEPKDTNTGAALDALLRDHPRWTKEEAQYHLDEAIAAGAFAAPTQGPEE